MAKRTQSRARRNSLATALLPLLVWLFLTPPASAQLGLGSLIVTITSPTSGSVVRNTIPVNASVSIVGALTVSRVEFYVDGRFLGNDTASPYSVSWDTGTVSNGSHT